MILLLYKLVMGAGLGYLFACFMGQMLEDMAQDYRELKKLLKK